MKPRRIGVSKPNDWLERDHQCSDTHEGHQALDSDEALDAALRRELIELSGTDQHLAMDRIGRK
jgi:hypothetical protein